MGKLSPVDEFRAAAANPAACEKQLRSVLSKKSNDSWTLPIVLEATRGTPDPMKRLLAAHTLRCVGPGRIKKVTFATSALRRLESLADTSDPAVKRAMAPRPRKAKTPRPPGALPKPKFSAKSKQRKGRKPGDRSVRTVSGGAPGLGKRR